MLLRFIAREADVNATTNKGMTALMFAAPFGLLQIARTLIAAGAKVNVTDNAGYTAISIATEAEQHEMVAILENQSILESIGNEINQENPHIPVKVRI